MLQGEKLTETTLQCFRNGDLSEIVNSFAGFVGKNDHFEPGFVSGMPDDRRGESQEVFGAILGYNGSQNCMPSFWLFVVCGHTTQT